MKTEITEKRESGARLFYDAECRFCCRAARRFDGILARRGFVLRPLQSSDAPQCTGLPGRGAFREMRLLLPDGRDLGGGDAVAEIARHIWWAWPLWLISRLPGVGASLRGAYRVIAANRHCIGGSCKIRRSHGGYHWQPLLLLPIVAIAGRNVLPAWVFMWVLAFAIFLGCKWLTLRRALSCSTAGASFAYLFLWPGMNAETFLGRATVERSKPGEWFIAGAKTMAGAILLWLASSKSHQLTPLLAGWLGMIGLVMLLHFGIFHLLSLFWRTAGRNAKPLMRTPLLATSLADFWGSRWNSAFNQLAGDLIFRKLARPLGVAWATVAVFLVSGLIHDLVISLPARGGYGWPTAYFILQSAGVLFERSKRGRLLGIGQGVRGWLFMVAVVALPAFTLFHPPFIHHVILPMLHAIGAPGNML